MARKAPFTERLTRRLAILRGRSRRSLPGAAPNHKSVFVHMPKCGGTSLSEAMYATVPFNERIGVIDAVSTRSAAAMMHFDQHDRFLCHEDLEHGQHTFDLREAMMLQHMAWGTMLIHGHVFWSDKAQTHFGNSYKYVTLLRDPVARMVSNFRMTQRAGIVGEDVDEYLESPVARRHAQVYLRYLSGRNDIDAADTDRMVAMAKERLAGFALVGFLDDTESFFANYKKVFGVPLKMARLNSAPDKKPPYSDSQMAKFKELCSPDLEIYDFAKELRASKPRTTASAVRNATAPQSS